MPSLQSKLHRDDPEALVIHCGDHRFQGGFYEFLNRVPNLRGSYDLMVIPGGPQTLNHEDHLAKFDWVTWKWLRFFTKHHTIRRLVLIQHQDCGWYKTMVHMHALAEIRQRQGEDLRRAHKELKRDFPKLKVELYYAGWDMNEAIVIESVTP